MLKDQDEHLAASKVTVWMPCMAPAQIIVHLPHSVSPTRHRWQSIQLRQVVPAVVCCWLHAVCRVDEHTYEPLVHLPVDRCRWHHLSIQHETGAAVARLKHHGAHLQERRQNSSNNNKESTQQGKEHITIACSVEKPFVRSESHARCPVLSLPKHTSALQEDQT
jgi:hypothetical protein